MWIRNLLFLLLVSACTFENEDTTATYDILYLQRNGADMPVHIHGNVDSKVMIIVLHGGPGGNGLQYRPGVFKEELEKNYAVAYFDQRGQGMSQGHQGKASISLPEIVEDVNALIQVIKHKYGENMSLFLFGHSWGGTLGTAFMTTKDYQNEVKGWIEVDGAHDFDLLLKTQIQMVERIAEVEIEEGRDQEFWEEFLTEIDDVDTLNYSFEDIANLNSYGYEAEEKFFENETIRDGTEDFLDPGNLLTSLFFSVNPITSAISGYFTSTELIIENNLLESRIADQLHLITTPTLLLWGKYDFVVPSALGEQAFREINTDDKKLVIYDESGHSPMSSEGPLFKDEVIQFIEKYK